MIDKKKALPVLAIFAIVTTVLFSNQAYAEVEKGRNFDREIVSVNPNGTITYKWTSTPDRILDGNLYKDYVLREDSYNIYLETAHLSLLFNKAACTMEMFDGGRITGNANMVLSHTVKEAVNGTDIWYAIMENDTQCNYSISENGKQVKLTAWKGDFVTIYDIDYRWGFEWTYKYTNTKPEKTDHKYGFTFVCSGEQCTDIKVDGQPVPEGTLEKNKLLEKNIRVGGLGFDHKNKVHDYLWVMKKTNNSMIVDFTHSKGALPIGETLEVDPTFTADTPTIDGRLRATTGSCTGGFSKSTTGTTMQVGVDSANACLRGFAEWDLTGLNAVSVSDVDIDFEVSSTVGTPRVCDVKAVLTARPSTATDSALWTDLGDGTTYVDDSATCQSTGVKSLDLGATADTDVFNQIAAGWFAIGWKYDSEAVSGADHSTFIAAVEHATMTPPTLIVTYTEVPPDPPTNLSCTSIARQVSCTWNAPANASPVSGYFFGRSLDNSTWPGSNKTSIANVTSLVDASYWRIGQLYHVNITSTTAANTNSTTSAFDSFTMDNVPNTPSLALARLNSTLINATSTAGASDGGDAVKDFGLRCEINSAGGWIDVVSNSTLPTNRSHSIGAIWSDDNLIKCQWRDGNSVSWSDWSANATYPSRPDAVTDLAVVGIFQTTAEIEWSEPNLHGLNLTGYQVNFTSPWSNPLTEITTTNTSDTEYAVTGLVSNTQYSFRVSAVTLAGNNASGNIINFITATNFTVGQIDIDSDNPLRMPIRFVRDDINATTTALTVTYDNDYDLTCDMFFKFSQTNQTFPNINGTAASSSEDEHTFYFLNPETEVINVDCYDTLTNETGSYLMMQSDFPLLDLIAGFRDGTYGTQGMFGAIDLITLMAIILGMIGFNRTNPSVGLIFMFFIMGGLAVFGIVQWYTAVTGLVATLLLFAVGSTAKND